MVGDTAESRAPGNIIVYGVQCCRIRERATTSIHRGERGSRGIGEFGRGNFKKRIGQCARVVKTANEPIQSVFSKRMTELFLPTILRAARKIVERKRERWKFTVGIYTQTRSSVKNLACSMRGRARLEIGWIEFPCGNGHFSFSRSIRQNWRQTFFSSKNPFTIRLFVVPIVH